MEIEVLGSNSVDFEEERKKAEKDQVRVKWTLKTVLKQCQIALELLSNTDGLDDDDNNGDASYHGSGANEDTKKKEMEEEEEQVEEREDISLDSSGDREASELCDLLKSGVEFRNFLEKLECAQASFPQNIAEEGSSWEMINESSWDMVNENDLWEGENDGSNQEDYVLVQQEDIEEGIAYFMAAYLLSLKQTKHWTPEQLQEALGKTFSVKKRKGKLQKAWDGSKVIYNVASWGATAIGIYQNPVILEVASKAFWTSCHVMSKLL